MITTLQLTAYLTVYDGLSPWYRAAVRVQKPRRNGHFLEAWMGGNGFRDRISGWVATTARASEGSERSTMLGDGLIGKAEAGGTFVFRAGIGLR